LNGIGDLQFISPGGLDGFAGIDYDRLEELNAY
jgi:hypothetical protein